MSVAVFTHSHGAFDGHRLTFGAVIPVTPEQSQRLSERLAGDATVYPDAARTAVQLQYDSTLSAYVVTGSYLLATEERPTIPPGVNIPGLEAVGRVEIVAAPEQSEPIMLRLSDLRPGEKVTLTPDPEPPEHEPTDGVAFDDADASPDGLMRGTIKCPSCPADETRLWPSAHVLARHVEFVHTPQHAEEQASRDALHAECTAEAEERIRLANTPPTAHGEQGLRPEDREALDGPGR